MSDTTGKLKDLIELLHDGEKFYTEAATKVKVPAFANLFARMARMKQAIANDLSTQVGSHGEKAPTGGTMFGALRQLYTDIRASMSRDAEAVYVAQLEQTEDRILEAFRDELTKSDNVEVRNIAERHYPEIKRAHDEMRDLKSRLAA
ncbi:PA2169 family four-helix-bundle protein [Tahibacter amnicola]|uniref:PA2169 family four-helix-bundle protein n=1 Tax=Tahibacter amnicola TaxID=2976241 RepID=A0ABY6BE35_9GAMM|nr:PA2169 family four-helix-bundle protein [Tahibacter amnicola]UXI68303.1 PA2169 family four-helix-bundle protein [Tahibacter amnicola]